MSDENKKPNFQGKYKLIKSENMEEFLAANGANWMVRKMANNLSPTLTVTQDGNKFSTKLASVVHTKENSFIVGEEFEETQASGDVMKVLPTWEGNKLVLTYESKVAGKGKPQKLIRELEGDDLMIVTMIVEDITAKRIFQRQKV